jgi:hypothetical protein
MVVYARINCEHPAPRSATDFCRYRDEVNRKYLAMWEARLAALKLAGTENESEDMYNFWNIRLGQSDLLAGWP